MSSQRYTPEFKDEAKKEILALRSRLRRVRHPLGSSNTSRSNSAARSRDQVSSGNASGGSGALAGTETVISHIRRGSRSGVRSRWGPRITSPAGPRIPLKR